MVDVGLVREEAYMTCKIRGMQDRLDGLGDPSEIEKELYRFLDEERKLGTIRLDWYVERFDDDNHTHFKVWHK